LRHADGFKHRFQVACLLSTAALVRSVAEAVAQSNRLQTRQAVVSSHASLVVNARPGRTSVTIYGSEATKAFLRGWRPHRLSKKYLQVSVRFCLKDSSGAKDLGEGASVNPY
jgi:hypothetical protein